MYHFDDARRAVVVTDPHTPMPWINYLSNGRLHAFASQAGGGSAWWRSPQNYRLTRYRSWMAPVEGPGFYLYVQDEDGELWSPSLLPCRSQLDERTSEHRPGFSSYTGRRDGMTVTQELFMAQSTDDLVWNLKLTNAGPKPRKLKLTAYVETGQLEYLQELQWGYYVRHMFQTAYSAETGAATYLYHHQSHPAVTEIPLVYLVSTEPTASWCGDRAKFLGSYGTEQAPLSLTSGDATGAKAQSLPNASSRGGDPCLALQIEVVVPAGGEVTPAFFLGVLPDWMADTPSQKLRLAERVSAVRQADFVQRERQTVKAWWEQRLESFACELPDKNAQRQINTWTPVNVVHVGRYSRSFSQQASGIRGFGYRDTAQDMVALAHRDPAWALAEFLRLLTYQYRDGHAVHAYFPEDKQAPWTSVHSDDHLWLVNLVWALVSETGDLSLLDRKTVWLDGGEATVWDHLKAALGFTMGQLGAHGLPLTLKSDWNDCLGKFARAGKGETVMVAQQALVDLDLMTKLAELTGRKADVAELALADSQLRKTLEGCAWDGQWWKRGFDDNGDPIGSSASPQAQIWLNSQSWAVLCGLGSAGQQRQGMDSAYRRLDTARGLKKIDPSFPSYPDTLDVFAGYSPGAGENGAIFCHANTWAIMADALLGNTDRAWQLFLKLVPHNALTEAGLDVYQAEPYAWASSILGPENPGFGRAVVPHVTGTAAWMDIAATQYLLGLRPEPEGLRLDPRLPKTWKGCTVRRRFRGTDLDVRITRGKVTAVTVSVDGVAVADQLVRADLLFGKTHAVVEVQIP